MKKFFIVFAVGLLSLFIGTSLIMAQSKGPGITIIGEVKIDEKEHFKCVCEPRKTGKCIAAKAITFGRICKKAKGDDQDCSTNNMNCPTK